MRILPIITVIVAMAVVAGCSSARKNRTAPLAPPAPSAPDAPAPAEIYPEVAPFGNEALAGKPGEEEDASTHVWDFRDATTWLLGDITPAMFLNQPHSEWYLNGYRDYQPDPAFLAELVYQETDDLTITIVLGTWCPDSRREVPRFMKIVDLWGFPAEKIRFIGVDINKIAPLADYPELAIERVPTFIFYKNNSEKGRIIEVPVTSLEQDTRNILTGK
jgi:thiol-disulfide isomerase/thioredoxin